MSLLRNYAALVPVHPAPNQAQPGHPTKEAAARAILRRCGIVLILAGAVDITWMIWCFASSRSYSSSLNIFAVIGGYLLTQGNLNVARWVAMLSTFMIATCVMAMLATPFIFPFGYWLAVIRSGFTEAPLLLLTAATTALLYWLRGQLHRHEIAEAQARHGVIAPGIVRPAIIGALIPVVIVPLVGLMLHGATAREAAQRAELQLGSRYHYVVTNLQMHAGTAGTSVAAVVAAYNDTELKEVRISWKD